MPARTNASSNGAICAGVGVCVLIAVVIAGCAARFNHGVSERVVDSSLLRLNKGARWTYVGTVEWTVGTNVSRADIDWTMDVLDVVKGERVEAAIVRGFVSDLAWYEPGEAIGFTVIATEENRVYRFSCDDEMAARMQAEKIATEGVGADAEVWLDLALKQGKRWAFDPQRTDLWYCWYVEEEALRTVAVPGISPRKQTPTWQVVYRTAPDHQVFTIAEGFGIVGYEYEHHGTVARAKVALSGAKVAGN